MQYNERIVQLLYRRLKGLTLTFEENQELDTWLARSDSNRKILENLSDEEWLKQARKRYYAPGKEAGLAQLREQLFAEEQPAPKSYGKVVRRIAYAAAAVLILIAGGNYLLGPTKQATEITKEALADLKNTLELTPGGEAILTLSNGTKIPLRDNANGLLAKLSDGKQLLKQDGKLVYQSAVAQQTAGGVDYSTDPRSDQYSSVVLPDGSRVWLNRSSRISYPETFAADKRVVELEGEGYFEIAKAYAANGKDRLPFIVRLPAQSNSTSPSEVEVLGTHFNIYAHQGEPVKTTLMEGKVKMRRGAQGIELKPGQQAVVDASELKMDLKNDVDTARVLSWKKARFDYKNEKLKTILDELQRWYARKDGGTYGIIQTEEVTTPYSFIYDRNKPISEVIKQLSAIGNVRMEVVGNNIVVHH